MVARQCPACHRRTRTVALRRQVIQPVQRETVPLQSGRADAGQGILRDAAYN